MIDLLIYHASQRKPTYAEVRRRWKRRLKARARDRKRRVKTARAP